MDCRLRHQLQPLQPLALSPNLSVGQVVAQLRHCAIGARHLGEVADTLTHFVQTGQPPLLITDHRLNTPLGLLLRNWVKAGWARGLVSPDALIRDRYRSTPTAVVIGLLPERIECEVLKRCTRTIFINPYGYAAPGQIRDGSFPDVVFSDPTFVLPVLSAVLDERLRHDPMSVSELLLQLQQFGKLGQDVAEGAETLRVMVEDPELTAILTLSGIMTVAKMGPLICDLIDRGMVQAIVSTGALMAHGLVEGQGLQHYQHDPRFDDAQLAAAKLNRITDSLEPEENLDETEAMIHQVMQAYGSKLVSSPVELNHRIGQYLTERYPDHRAILKSAYQRGVPVLVPALVDSELGNDIYVRNLERVKQGLPRRIFDPSIDSAGLVELASRATRLGIFTIGGGVPRNYAQNVAPLIEIINDRLIDKVPLSKFSMGCRICPDPQHLGHLSGCTYHEGMSWRKMELDGRFSEIMADATMVFPFYVQYLLDRAQVPANKRNHVCELQFAD